MSEQLLMQYEGEYLCPGAPDQHGPMAQRPIGKGTPEQDWCGTWYECQRCASSTLLPSPALTAQLAEQAKSRSTS